MRKLFILGSVCALSLAGCGGSATAPLPPAVASPVTPTPEPTSWAISGRILNAPSGSPIPGAAIRFGDAPAVPSDGSGIFTLITTDRSPKSLIIEAAGFLTRETSLTGGEARTGVDFDLIGDDPGFPRAQFLHEARNAFESPNRHEPIRRWTTNPNVYISTAWRETGVPVRAESIAFLVSEIRRTVPLWSDGRLQAGTIETGAGARPLTKGWINVEFGASGNWSRLGEDPGQVQFGSEGTCISLAIVHEFGHALGFWHTSVRPSIMGGAPGSCSLSNLTATEAAIARVVYSREPGNLEPDKDGPPPPPPIYTLSGLGRPGSSSGIVYCDTLLRR